MYAESCQNRDEAGLDCYTSFGVVLGCLCAPDANDNSSLFHMQHVLFSLEAYGPGRNGIYIRQLRSRVRKDYKVKHFTSCMNTFVI